MKSEELENKTVETPAGEALEASAPVTGADEMPENDVLPAGKKISLRSVFLGDIFVTDFLRRQAVLLLLVTIYTVIYISNRYSYQQEMIEIDRLRKQLVDVKYDALTRSSELTERTRQSHIEEYVASENSELQTSTAPPFVIE